MPRTTQEPKTHKTIRFPDRLIQFIDEHVQQPTTPDTFSKVVLNAVYMWAIKNGYEVKKYTPPEY